MSQEVDPDVAGGGDSQAEWTRDARFPPGGISHRGGNATPRYCDAEAASPGSRWLRRRVDRNRDLRARPISRPPSSTRSPALVSPCCGSPGDPARLAVQAGSNAHRANFKARRRPPAERSGVEPGPNLVNSPMGLDCAHLHVTTRSLSRGVCKIDARRPPRRRSAARRWGLPPTRDERRRRALFTSVLQGPGSSDRRLRDLVATITWRGHRQARGFSP